MVTPRNRPINSDAHQLQGLGLPPVQGSEKELVLNDGPFWTINVGPLRIHDTHVRDGQRYSKRCRICRKDVASFIREVETEVPYDDVAARRRNDEERAAALASDRERTEERESKDQLW